MCENSGIGHIRANKQKRKERDFVVKSNALIEARYRLGLQETRVVFWILSQINPHVPPSNIFVLTVKELAELAGVRVESFYSEVKQITRALTSRPITIKSEGKYIQVCWLSGAEYKDGMVTLEVSSFLMPHLAGLKREFTKLDIDVVCRVRSVYAVRVFELLKQYESIGKRIISVAELREYCGIASHEMRNYSALKECVLERACSEINSKSNYEVSYREIKQSRKIVSHEWTIKKISFFEKMQHEKADVIYKEMRSRHDLIVRLGEYGFSKQLAKRLVAGRDEEVVSLSIDAAEQQIKKGFVKQPQAMITKAINECWKPNYS